MLYLTRMAFSDNFETVIMLLHGLVGPWSNNALHGLVGPWNFVVTPNSDQPMEYSMGWSANGPYHCLSPSRQSQLINV